MTRVPNGKPRSAGDLAREMVELLKQRHQPTPPPNAPVPPPSHRDPEERKP